MAGETLAIWKFPVEVADTFSVQMPSGARVLAVQMQHAKPCLWALVTPSAPVHYRQFFVFGTGHDIAPEIAAVAEYVGTFQLHGGSLVFHLFARKETDHG